MPAFRTYRALLAGFIAALIPAQLVADHTPSNAGRLSVFERYQEDASAKRYADIMELALILDAYSAANGTLPLLDAEFGEEGIYRLVPLGQTETIDELWREGSPFNFSLFKYRPEALIRALEEWLDDDVSLPIDPQKVSTGFWPAYFVFLRDPQAGGDPYFIVVGTFAHAVLHSSEVSEGIHIVAISDRPDVKFIVPMVALSDFSEETRAHIFAEGDRAEGIFRQTTQTRTD